MAKRVKFAIDNLIAAKEALNDALQNALTVMAQKGASEAAVSIMINIDMPGIGLDGTMVPQIKYKTSVKVPLDIKNIGCVKDVSQLYWDQDVGGWTIRIEGEQMKIE